MGQEANVTIGADTFVVYATSAAPVTDATTFFNGRLGAASAAWTEATADDQARALVMARAWYDRALTEILSGTRTVSSQQGVWPRDAATCRGVTLADDSVPDDAAYAEFVLAGILLQDAAQAASDGTGSNVKAVRAGSASVDFFIPTLNGGKDKRLPTEAWDYVRCYLGSTASTFAPYITGTDVAALFGDDDFGLSGPLP
jgi:Putative DnaT-like ssDNA binding protein